MKYRILYNRRLRSYKVQEKGWFLWYDLGETIFDGLNSVSVTHYGGMDEAFVALAKHKLEAAFKKKDEPKNIWVVTYAE